MAAVLTVAAVAGIGSALPAGAAESLTVSATTGLRDGQVVDVAGVVGDPAPWTPGTTPGTTTGTAGGSAGTLIPPAVVGSVPGSAPQHFPYVLVTQCAAGETAYDACLAPRYVNRGVDGSFTGTYQLTAVLHLPGRSVDCRVSACELRAGHFSEEGDSLAAGLSFDRSAPLRPAPVVTVTPSADLTPGDFVVVNATNLPDDGPVAVLQCVGDAIGLDRDRCQQVAGRWPGEGRNPDFGFRVTAQIRVGGYGNAPGTVECRFSPTGCKVVVIAGSSVVDTPITFAPPGDRPFVDDRFAVDVQRDITYGHAVGQKGPQDLKLDLYTPRDTGTGPRPAVVYAHGGYFAFGDKSEGSDVGNALAARGYVVISIQYRLYEGELNSTDRYLEAIPAAQHDAQAAVRWLRANATTLRVSPDAIGIMGYSAGAVTALGVAFHSDDVGTSGNPGPSSAVQAAVSLAGGNGDLRGPVPPIRMFHGTNDDIVPFAAGEKACAEVVAYGQSCELTGYPDIGHSIYSRYDDWLPELVEFFGATLVPALEGRPPTLRPTPVPTEAALPATVVPASPTFTG